MIWDIFSGIDSNSFRFFLAIAAGLLQGHGRVCVRRSQRVQELLEKVRRESRFLPVYGCAEYASSKGACPIQGQLVQVRYYTHRGCFSF